MFDPFPLAETVLVVTINVEYLVLQSDQMETGHMTTWILSNRVVYNTGVDCNVSYVWQSTCDIILW